MTGTKLIVSALKNKQTFRSNATLGLHSSQFTGPIAAVITPLVSTRAIRGSLLLFPPLDRKSLQLLELIKQKLPQARA